MNFSIQEYKIDLQLLEALPMTDVHSWINIIQNFGIIPKYTWTTLKKAENIEAL